MKLEKIEAVEPIVELQMTLVRAEQFRDALADILCWCAGFVAAGGVGPLNTDVAGELYLHLRAIADDAHAREHGKQS